VIAISITIFVFSGVALVGLWRLLVSVTNGGDRVPVPWHRLIVLELRFEGKYRMIRKINCLATMRAGNPLPPRSLFQAELVQELRAMGEYF
jgi:hypothetical protein